jgi:hypothetical protein
MKLKSIAETIIYEQSIDAIDSAMETGFDQLGKDFKLKQDEIEKEIESQPVSEAVGIVTVIGFILAAPALLEILAKGLGKVIKLWQKVFKKGTKEDSEIVQAIVNFTHKWHKKYSKGLKWILDKSGLFAKANITSNEEKEKASELVFYIIVAAMALYSGIGAYSAFKSGLAALTPTTATSSFSLAAFESAMTAIKSKEVSAFLQKML